MKTTIMTSKNIHTVNYDVPDIAVINESAAVLSRGGIVAAPTETRYGLLARADDKIALDNLYALKKRPTSMATSVFIRAVDEIDRVAYSNSISEKLAVSFLPGSLTLVMKSKLDLPAPVVIDGKIGIRISPAPFIRALLGKINYYVTATSANLSGAKDCTTIDEVYESFGNDIGLYVDAGKIENKVSTVIDVSDGQYRILREGAISDMMIRDALRERN